MANNRGSQDCPGKITQIIGAVLDIKFPEGALPEINDAIRVPLKNGGELVVEASQHLGDDTVRCIAMGPTDGLVARYGGNRHGRTDQRAGRREYARTHVQRSG